MSDDTPIDAVTLATELTIAWLGNANTRVTGDDVQAFLKTMYETISSLEPGPAAEEPAAVTAPEYTPAVTVRKSLGSPDHIISMIDGKPYKTLRRHLGAQGLTPAEYRTRYNLKSDYPMVAPGYSAARREMAKKIGLGRKPGQTVTKKASPVAPKAAARAPVRRKAKNASTGS